jgi:hypothetical protein
MSAVKLSYNFIEIKCQFLNYYKAPLTCKVMEDTGIKCPVSLDIDMRGQLWVACYKQSGATIHKVKLL